MPHISVCICTFKRVALLERLLEALGSQSTDGRFTFSIVVVDNDRAASARSTVSEFAAKAVVPVEYCQECTQSIALARNRAVTKAWGDYLAFIDDDEFPSADWLLILFGTIEREAVAGILGPVLPHFDVSPPAWILKGGFYKRPSYPSGTLIRWQQGRTGNVLLHMKLFENQAEPFDQKFITGEDQDFFRRMIEKGHRFLWCNEAVAYEVVPPNRWRRAFMMRRALLRGKVSLLDPTHRLRKIILSMVAVPMYGAALPFLMLAGHHNFMKYLIKLCDHSGRLLAVVHLNPVADTYVAD